MKSITLLSTVLALSASTLLAGPINYDAATDGLTAPAGATFSATGPAGSALVTATKNGITFLGVDGGEGSFAGPEIDLGEAVNIAFDEAVIFNSLTFGLLFNGREYGDLNEIAASLTNGTSLYELRVTGENAGEWYKDGVFQSNIVGVGTVNGGAGLWSIANPFGTSKVSSLEIYPLPSFGPLSNSDFGLVAFSTSVPDAGSSLALIGIAFLALAGFSRRAKRS